MPKGLQILIDVQELQRLRFKTQLQMGVGSGRGQHFVHGDSESIHIAQKKLLAGEEARRLLMRAQQVIENGVMVNDFSLLADMKHFLEQ